MKTLRCGLIAVTVTLSLSGTALAKARRRVVRVTAVRPAPQPPPAPLDFGAMMIRSHEQGPSEYTIEQRMPLNYRLPPLRR